MFQLLLSNTKSVKTSLTSFIALSFFIALFSSNSMAAGDATRGESLGQTCLGCHGAPGLRNASPVYKVPMIGGQHAAYIVSALEAYKSKARSHPTMQAQAASLTDQDMADIAAYFAALTGETKVITKSGAAAGKEKAAQCAGCHGLTGNGENTSFPKLAGQYDDYLERALLDYQSGKRNNPIMSGIAKPLSKTDIKQLSQWFRSQQGDITAPVIKVKK